MKLDQFRKFLQDQRDRHPARSKFKRALLAVLGILLITASMPLMPLFWEIAIPLLLIGVTFLALEFEWANNLFHKILDFIESLLSRYPILSNKLFAAIVLIFSLAITIFFFLYNH